MDVKQENGRCGALSTTVNAPPTTAPRQGRGAVSRMVTDYRLRARSDIAIDLLTGVVGGVFAVAHALFGVYPFGLAFCASLGRHVLPAFIGAAIGCRFMGASGGLYLAAYGILLLLRTLFSQVSRRISGRGLFAEEPMFRVLSVTLVGCAMATYELVLFGVYDYTVLFALGTVFFPAFLTFVYTRLGEAGLGVREALGKAPYQPTGNAALLTEAAGVLLLFSVVYSLQPYVFFGISVGRCVLTAIVLLLAKRFGALRACAAGLIIALGDSLTYAPAFGLLGLLAGLYQNIGMPCALAAAVLAGGGYAASVGKLTGFLAIVPEMAITSLAAWPFLRFFERAEDDFFTVGTARPQPRRPRENKREKRIGFSKAYGDIAKALSESVRDEESFGAGEYEALCRRVKEGVCRRCEHASDCRAEDVVLRALAGTANGTEEYHGESGVCEAFSRMAEELRAGAADLLQKKRSGGLRGAFCTEYALHAKLLREAAQKRRDEEEEDETASAALAARLKEQGIAAENVTVFGKRMRRIRLSDVRWQDGGEGGGDCLRAICTDVCGKGLDTGGISYNGKKITYYFESEEKFTAETAIASVPCRYGEPCGDRACGFSAPDGMAFAAVCDGMGSGKEAANAASVGVAVLSSLLSAGAETETTLEILGNLLCADASECSVSVDLLAVDLIKGSAVFHKSGAAASFVRRGEALYRIRAKTIPMGVFRSVDSEEVRLDLEDGDLLILLSDGVMCGNEDGGWLKELLRETLCEDLNVLARTVLAAAKERAAGDTADDMTVAITRVRRLAEAV